MFTDPSGYYQVPHYNFSYQDLSEKNAGGGYSTIGGYWMGVGLDGFRGSSYMGNSIGSIINYLLSTPFGGSYSKSGGVRVFKSSEDAFDAGIRYNDRHNSGVYRSPKC